MSELYDLSNEKIASLVFNQEFVDLLKRKVISETKCGHLGKFLLDLRKIDKVFTNRLVLAIPQKVFDNVLKDFNLRELADLIFVINSLPSNASKAKDIFNNVENRLIIEKVNYNGFRITDFQSIFKQFSRVSKSKTIGILQQIPDRIFIEKSTKFGFSARKTSQALNALNSIARDKINPICKQLFEMTNFQKLMKSSSPTDLANAYADFLQIDKKETVKIFREYLNNIPENRLMREDISGFSDGLRRIHRFDKLSINDKIIHAFEKHLIENIEHYRLRQISMCFRNLKHIDDGYSKQLIERIPIRLMVKKYKEVDSQENLNGSLGEIKIVSENYWNSLIKAIGYAKP